VASETRTMAEIRPEITTSRLLFVGLMSHPSRRSAKPGDQAFIATLAAAQPEPSRQ
jgi:hypothetical protein